MPSGFNDELHCNLNVSNSLPPLNDDSAKLAKILTDFAEEIVDISIVDNSDSLEQQEINERLSYYAHKLGANGSKLVKDNSQGNIEVRLDGLSIQELKSQLQEYQVSEENRTLVSRVAKQVNNLMANVRVEPNEFINDMVVDLGEE